MFGRRFCPVWLFWCLYRMVLHEAGGGVVIDVVVRVPNLGRGVRRVTGERVPELL